MFADDKTRSVTAHHWKESIFKMATFIFKNVANTFQTLLVRFTCNFILVFCMHKFGVALIYEYTHLINTENKLAHIIYVC